jgi:TolB protein
MNKIAKAVILSLFAAIALHAQQDWIRTGTGLGVEKIRLAAADFKLANAATTGVAGAPSTGAMGGNVADLTKVFNDTLWNDLDNAGIFDMVSKSFYPLQQPGSPSEMQLQAWGNPPPSAAMVAFGNTASDGQNLNVQGWLYDVRNAASPMVLGKQYKEPPTSDGARDAAHKFANEIIFRLGGGVQGIAESKIAFVSRRGGNKEIWVMDYDGANQHQVTRLGTIALGPKFSPDASRIAFSALRGNWEIMMYSLVLNRMVTFPRLGSMNTSPTWAPDGLKIAFSSSRTGDPEIFLANADGTSLKRITNFRGPDVSPVFNPKGGAQIAWVSGQTGLPQIWIMEADGTNPQRLTDQGYAVSPSWSPNGQFLAFSWLRRYGPGAPGARDIYVMDIATRKWIQLTHDGGANDFPSWSPDGRHIVFQSTRSGSEQIWSMLADGTQAKQLTFSGSNSQPSWSPK